MVTVAQLRGQLAKILAELRKKGGPLYVTQRGHARAVLLGSEEYRALMEQLEYLDDSLEVLRARERRASGKERSRPLGAVKRALLGRGRLPR